MLLNPIVSLDASSMKTQFQKNFLSPTAVKRNKNHISIFVVVNSLSVRRKMSLKLNTASANDNFNDVDLEKKSFKSLLDHAQVFFFYVFVFQNCCNFSPMFEIALKLF
jgi:hypothetical protein